MDQKTKKAVGIGALFAALAGTGFLDFLSPEVTGALGTFIDKNPLTVGAVLGLVALVGLIFNFKKDLALRSDLESLTDRVAELETGGDTSLLVTDSADDDDEE